MADAIQNEIGMAFALYDERTGNICLTLSACGQIVEIDLINPEGLLVTLERARKAQESHTRNSARLLKPQPAAVIANNWEV